MNTDFDSQLTRLFAEQNEALPADAFLRQTVQRLEREYRWQRIRMAAGVAIIVAVAAMIGSKVDAIASAILQSATEMIASTLSLSSLPGMVIGGVMLALLPVVYVWRMWRI